MVGKGTAGIAARGRLTLSSKTLIMLESFDKVGVGERFLNLPLL